MPNYLPTVNPGEIRRRIWRNENENTLGQFPAATMHEEEVVRLADGSEVSLRRTATLTMAPSQEDFARVVDLRDPLTDNIITQTTLGAIYAHIYSLGRVMQLDRDARVLAENTPPVDP